MNKSVRERKTKVNRYYGKVAVMGLLERHEEDTVTVKPGPNVRRPR